MSGDAKPTSAASAAGDGAMPAMTLALEDTSRAMAEAVDWMVRLTSEEASEADLHALERWRQTSPDNDEAYRALAAIRPIGSALRTEQRVTRRALLAGSGVAMASIAVLGVARPPLGLWPSLAELTADHRTGVGQRMAFTPSAGVKVELNSRSSASLASGGGGNRIRLIGGEGFVQIDRASAFTVEVKDAVLTAKHATFNVETLAGGVRATCVVGQIECSAGGRSVSLTPGQEWRVASDGTVAVRRVDTKAVAGWRSGILRFNRARLAEVVEQFNRYRSAPIVLAGESVGNRPVSGYFYTQDIDAATAQIVQLLQLRARALPGDVLLIS